jgi:hypothetical protein
MNNSSPTISKDIFVNDERSTVEKSSLNEPVQNVLDLEDSFLPAENSKVKETKQQTPLNTLVPNLTSGQQEALKWLAIVTMTIDHINALLFNYSEQPLFWIGRLAFPLFAFLMAYNLVVRKVKPTRYVYPLVVFALCTQPVYYLVFNNWTGNIFMTLALGVLFVGLQRMAAQRIPMWLSYLFIAPLVAIPALHVDYGIPGVFLIPVVVFFLEHPRPLLLVGLGFYLLAVNTFGPYSVMPLLLVPIIYFMSRFDLPLRRANPWLFYLFYPVHLLVLEVIQRQLY